MTIQTLIIKKKDYVNYFALKEAGYYQHELPKETLVIAFYTAQFAEKSIEIAKKGYEKLI